jgi:hypothetical protein
MLRPRTTCRQCCHPFVKLRTGRPVSPTPHIGSGLFQRCGRSAGPSNRVDRPPARAASLRLHASAIGRDGGPFQTCLLQASSIQASLDSSSHEHACSPLPPPTCWPPSGAEAQQLPSQESNEQSPGSCSCPKCSLVKTGIGHGRAHQVGRL